MRFSDHLERVREKFAQELRPRFEAIRALFQATPNDAEARKALQHQLHRLVGAAGTFKANRISEVARHLEIYLSERTRHHLDDEWDIVERLFSQLEQAVDEYLQGGARDRAPALRDSRLALDHKLIYLVEDDALQAGKYAETLRAAGYQVRSFGALGEFTACMREEAMLPALILIDMMFASERENGAQVIDQLRKAYTEFPPVIFISVMADVETQIAALRAGGVDYLTKPLTAERLLDKVGEYLEEPLLPTRVLLVDDDEVVLEFVARVLERAGMDVKALTDPLAIFETLADFRPDLMILDIHMPRCTGHELAAIVRQRDEYALLPIVFLTADTQLDVEIAAKTSGGDDFVSKNATQSYLLHVVRSRLRRMRRIRSITERLVRDQRLAEQISRSRGDFLAYVAHELKSPLNVVMGYAQLLELANELGEDERAMIQDISRASRQQFDMLKELAEIAHIESGTLPLNMAVVDLLPLLDEAVAMAGGLAQRLQLELLIRADLSEADRAADWRICVDARRLQQVLNNLLSNAVKYNRQGGQVRVALARQPDGFVRISVEDTGIGIEPEQIPLVFNDFERLSAAKSQVEGAGIGLSITRQLVQLMGGRLGVYSTWGVGSTFWCELRGIKEVRA